MKSFPFFNFKSVVKSVGIWGLFVSVTVASAQNGPVNIEEENILPMQRILESARQKQRNALDNQDAARSERFPLMGPVRKTRTYKMGALGLQTFNKNAARANEPNRQDLQREADATDGRDVTAFEEVDSPLDNVHLQSFKLCKASRTEQGINNVNVYWAAALSAIAYLKYPLAFDRLKTMGFEEVYFIEGASDTEVLVAKILPKYDAKGVLIPDSGQTVVSFRGTDNAVDWLTNLNASTNDISDHSHEAWLHEGFALALDEVYSEIIKAIDVKNNPSPIFITGHSLGGALGTQMAIRMISRESPQEEALIGTYDDRIRGIYVFAIPRVGNEWARNILDKYMNRNRNVMMAMHNNLDPVPKVAFDWMGYRRFGLQTLVPFSLKPEESHFGDRSRWKCYSDADFRGPSAFSLEFLDNDIEAHSLRSYVQHVTPFRSLVTQETCNDISPIWGPRYEEQDPTAFQSLKLPSQVGIDACYYSPFSWGGNIQL